MQRGDTLLSVAAMAKTTLKAILQMNADLAVSGMSSFDLSYLTLSHDPFLIASLSFFFS